MSIFKARLRDISKALTLRSHNGSTWRDWTARHTCGRT